MAAPVATTLLLLALGGALYYRGEFGLQLAALCAAVIALHLWLLGSLYAAWRRARSIPLGGVGAALLAWWAWLAFSLYWHPVPYTGRTAFWILGCAPLAFLAYVSAPDRERLWPLAFGGLVALATGLAVQGVWQYAVDAIPPRSIFLNPNSHAALLNLVALPLAGVFVSGAGPAARRRAALLAPPLALLIFSVTTVQGRGALGGLWLGLLLVFAAGAREGFAGRPLRWLALSAVCVLAFLAGELGPVRGREMGALGRLARSVGGPADFLGVRGPIWSASYAMLRDAPWHGAGLGTFYYHFAQRRPYPDRSSGAHAHNDYLEIGFEAGAPALALTLLIGLATGVGFGRIQLSSRASPDTRLEAAGLLAGLLAVAGHSVVSFNFYQPGIMVAFGLILGRLQSLVPGASSARMGRAPLGVAGAATGVVVLLAARLGTAALLFQVQVADDPDAEAAPERIDAYLGRALALAPELDPLLYSRAYWCLRRLQTHRDAPLDERRALLARGLDLAARAEHANPFRLPYPQLRAALCEIDPDLTQARKRAIAIGAQRRMLELDPHALEPRLRLAALLAAEGRLEESSRTVEEGSAYAHGHSAADALYRALLTRVRLEAGDLDGAAEAASQVDDILWVRNRQPPGFLQRLQQQLGRDSARGQAR